MPPQRLVVFLGNPGSGHARSRHNIAWRVGERLLSQHDGPSVVKRYAGKLALREIDGKKTALLFPQTYMNASGRSVRSALKGLRLQPDQLCVVHDDMDLGFATLRIRGGGKSGGHRGVESIIAAIGSPDFRRFKLGLGRPPGGQDPADYVLAPFSRAQANGIARLVDAAAAAIAAQGQLSFERLCNTYNRNWQGTNCAPNE